MCVSIVTIQPLWPLSLLWSLLGMAIDGYGCLSVRLILGEDMADPTWKIQRQRIGQGGSLPSAAGS